MLNRNTKSKDIYIILNKKHKIPKFQIKYASKGLTFDCRMWERFYSLPFRYIKDTTLLWFLAYDPYVDSNKCNFYKNAPETLQHLFYENIWKALQEWIFETLKMRISLNKHIVMFGMINGEINQLYAVNWLIINIKYHIYCTKIFGNNLDINSIKHTLQHKYQIDKFIYYKTCEYDKFNEYWGKWLHTHTH